MYTQTNSVMTVQLIITYFDSNLEEGLQHNLE
jgi:hypothetical protein